MRKPKTRILAVIAVGTVIMLAAAILGGCSGKSYSLTKDAALVSKWGDTVQFKVDKSWDDSNTSYSDSGYCAECWSSQNSKRDSANSVTLMLWNTGESAYKYHESGTYAGWQKSMEERYSKSAEDKAKELNSYPASTTADADELSSYSNCSIQDTGTVTVDGQEIRTFSVSYHYKYSDSKYQQLKERSSDAKQEGDTTEYYGLIKDDKHDLEVSTRDSQLLEDVLSTMSFSWQ